MWSSAGHRISAPTIADPISVILLASEISACIVYTFSRVSERTGKVRTGNLFFKKIENLNSASNTTFCTHSIHSKDCSVHTALGTKYLLHRWIPILVPCSEHISSASSWEKSMPHVVSYLSLSKSIHKPKPTTLSRFFKK